MQQIVLIADDDRTRRASVRDALSGSTFTLREIPRLGDLTDVSSVGKADVLVIASHAATTAVVLNSVAAVRRSNPRISIVIVMEGGSERLAAAAMRAGVKDYLPYPVGAEELIESVERCVTCAPRDDTHTRAVSPLIGSSESMASLRTYLTQVAAGRSNVLITGETGTGKELAAALVHEESDRRRRPFVPVVCAAIPDGLMESELFGHEKGAFTGAAAAREGLLQSAHGGTVFFDEVGDIGLPAQAKVLRAIETRQVYRVGGRAPMPLDVRIVAATNRDLEGAIDRGEFRSDLYFRLNVARVHLPPLRERRSDIGQLLDHYISQFSARAQVPVELSAEAKQALVSYDWPGNVRELKNLVECLFVCPRRDLVRINDFPEIFRRKLESFCSVDERERRVLLDALFAARWNKSRAAEILHCSRMTLYRRMARHAVSAPPSRVARPASQT